MWCISAIFKNCTSVCTTINVKTVGNPAILAIINLISHHVFDKWSIKSYNLRMGGLKMREYLVLCVTSLFVSPGREVRGHVLRLSQPGKGSGQQCGLRKRMRVTLRWTCKMS